LYTLRIKINKFCIFIKPYHSTLKLQKIVKGVIVMLCKEELARMKEAYIILYEIENMLRNYIKLHMEKSYGPQWFYFAPRKILKHPPSKSFDKLYFHEYERMYLRTYHEPFNNLSVKFYESLHELYPIRNKVAHNHNLNDEEVRFLNKVSQIIKSYLQ
jgi:hypothetical protein